ncbi:10 kDa chaperonin 1, chloroplastic-like isoform X5 [Camellia sinensis]|uniref:10 kDa chaperonin 1, chloroplastic-like isoform X5 n=1 Tax=Camellia sinensis TaxID=4442 RepID=UPI001036DE40|nr:10 kDa chaperonin 1, chloroplastic-like isoform X5 [Camellia sinensis]
MASTFITVSKAFTSHNNNNNPSSLSNQRLLGGCRNSVRVCAIAKEIEPTKVVPQADRVLIRLEKLPEILAVGAEVEQVEAGKKVLFSDINAYEGMRPVVHIHLTGDNYTLLMSC